MSTQRTYQFGGNGNSPFSGIVGIVIAVLFFLGMFYFVQFLFRILWFLLPVMVIATAIIDHKVILNYFSWVGRLFSGNWIAGLAVGALTIIGAPVVALFLLGRALLGRKINQVKGDIERREQGEFAEYEEIDSETLDLPEIEQPNPQPQKRDSGYDQMFD